MQVVPLKYEKKKTQGIARTIYFFKNLRTSAHRELTTNHKKFSNPRTSKCCFKHGLGCSPGNK